MKNIHSLLPSLRPWLATLFATAAVFWIFAQGQVHAQTEAVTTTGAGITATDRGAKIATDSYVVEIRDGIVVRILNKLTGEEYLDLYADAAKFVPHLPGGLGTQATDLERESASKLYKWPWFEHPAESLWPNQHSPSAASQFEFQAKDETNATLIYKGLSDGAKVYADESFTLELTIDKETGDLLLRPLVKSPRGGVFSSSLIVAPLAPAITAEAPIFDGVRLDRHMKPMLWVNQWGGYWDYAFMAFNGYKKGAVAVWCQDAELKYYKYLNYLINPEGLSFSFTALNIPPFEALKEAGTVTWRIQAFDKGWSQAVARFRDWRLKNVKIAKRPDWAGQISFVNGGVSAGKGWVDMVDSYFGSKNLDRTITFGATIRAEGFDVNHANNTPYKNFKEDMKYWKEKGPKMMAYLQPMIMWTPKPVTDREKEGVKAHKLANTVSVFQKPGSAKPVVNIDQHHLGHPDWQRWFLAWVKEYVEEYGADAVYHDQAYHCPVDSRGLTIGGMTTVQGMADYFYKAQTQSPNSLHGTEHMTEVNNVGASLGIGSGILWGTAESMRRQRIDHPSPVSNALHFPNGALFSFPHFSQINSRNLQFIHWGMNISEGRGELPYAALQSPAAALTQGLANERWMDVLRNQTFVEKGLRAVFPEDWDRSVVSYFKGAKGEDYRYVTTPWGSAFVQIDGDTPRLLYGRIHGTPYAQVEGGIYGWPFYNAKGPAGLHPNRYYVLDPGIKRPTAYFSSNNPFSASLYEGFVEEGFSTDAFAYLKIKPREDILNIIASDSVVLHAPAEPKAVYVNGKPVVPKPAGEGQWKIDFNFREPVAIVAILKDLPEGFEELALNAVGRTVGHDWAMDQFVVSNASSTIKPLPSGLSSDRGLLLVPVRAPVGQGETGTLKVAVVSKGPAKRLEMNGVEQPMGDPVMLKMKAGEQGLLSARADADLTLKCEWIPDSSPAPSPAPKTP